MADPADDPLTDPSPSTPPAANTANGADVVVVTGVSGCGKSTVAKGISAVTGWEFAEGDAFHSAADIAKMAANQALTDAELASRTRITHRGGFSGSMDR